MKSLFAPTRRFLRVAWRLPVSITSSSGTAQATSLDLSAGGMRVLVDSDQSIDADVQVAFELGGGMPAMQLPASVVRHLGECMIALTFEQVTAADRALLRGVVLQRAMAQVQAIGQYQAFRNLSDLDLLGLASISHELVLEPGDHAARYGDEATSMFLIRSGSVQLCAPAEADSGETKVEVAHAGQVFGEVAALLGLPHNLDIVALTPTELLVIPRSALVHLGDDDPQLALQLFEIFAAFMGRRLRRLTGRLISPLSY